MAFVKGQSGNTKGRPTRKAEDAKQSVLTRIFDERAEAKIISALINKACDGDVSAAKFLLERKYGKTPDKIEEKSDTVIRVEYR